VKLDAENFQISKWRDTLFWLHIVTRFSSGAMRFSGPSCMLKQVMLDCNKEFSLNIISTPFQKKDAEKLKPRGRVETKWIVDIAMLVLILISKNNVLYYAILK
jgi:hypothetical protein